MSDFGSNDTVYFCRTHLGHVLHPGDTVLGYDLATATYSNGDMEQYAASKGGASLPDVVLVRKSYEAKRRRRKDRVSVGAILFCFLGCAVFGSSSVSEQRSAPCIGIRLPGPCCRVGLHGSPMTSAVSLSPACLPANTTQGPNQRPWMLKRLAMEADEAEATARGRAGAQAAAADDKERFLQELEEDVDLRSRINIYRRKDAFTTSDVAGSAAAAAAASVSAASVAAQQQQQAHASRAPAGMDSDDGEEDDSGDLPEVPLEELLDDLEALDIGGQGAGSSEGLEDGEGEDGDDDGDLMED